MAELERTTTLADIQLREHDAMKAELPTLRAQLAEAQASERERAAKVADKIAEECASLPFAHGAARRIAAAIRALSPIPNQEKPE